MSRAEAPHESCDPALQDAVAGLLHLSFEERDSLNSYSIRTCDEKLQELLSYINDPTGKPQRTIPDILGQIAMLYQRKSELQTIEAQQKLDRLQHDNSRLRQEAQTREVEASYAQSRALAPQSDDCAHPQTPTSPQEAEAREASEGASEYESEHYEREPNQLELDLEAALKREAVLLCKLEAAQSGGQPTADPA